MEIGPNLKEVLKSAGMLILAIAFLYFLYKMMKDI